MEQPIDWRMLEVSLEDQLTYLQSLRLEQRVVVNQTNDRIKQIHDAIKERNTKRYRLHLPSVIEIETDDPVDFLDLIREHFVKMCIDEQGEFNPERMEKALKVEEIPRIKAEND